MKIPYIKIPIADIAAYIAPFSFEAKGKIFQAVLDFGLYQEWADLELSEREQIGYAEVREIVENEIKSYKIFCKKQKENAKKAWSKQIKIETGKKQHHDGANALPDTSSTIMPNPARTLCHTEAEAKAETDINKLLTSAEKSARKVEPKPDPKTKPKLNKLQEFSNAVLAEFEELETSEQIAVWFKRNCRCLTDILKFCGGEIPIALATIRVCVERLEKAGLSGGYEAVCRNLPEYYHEAKKRLAGGVYAN